jgi:hypothetical protein
VLGGTDVKIVDVILTALPSRDLLQSKAMCSILIAIFSSE